MYVLDQYRGTSVSCRYTVPQGLADPEARSGLVRAVEAALVDVVLRHPVLQVGIANADSKKPAWVQLSSLDLRRHVTWCFVDTSTEDDLDAAVQVLTASEVDGSFPDLSSQPGWRIVCVHQVPTSLLEVMFTWNHPHADGMSGKIFQEDLWQRLNTPIPHTEQSDEALDRRLISLPRSPPHLPPPIEDVCKLPISVRYTLKMIWEELGPSSLSWTRPSLAKWAPVRLSPYKTQFRAFTVESDALGRVLAACRQHETTLTGLLHALALASLAAQLSDETAPAFESGTTVNLRRFVPARPAGHPRLEPDRTMGNYVTLMSHAFSRTLVGDMRAALPLSAGRDNAGGDSRVAEIPAEDVAVVDRVWKVAAQVRGEISAKLAAGLRDDAVGVMRFVGDWRKQMADTARRPRQHSWWVTGVGVLGSNENSKRPEPDGAQSRSSSPQHDPARDEWAICRAQFALAAETTAAALVISPMTATGEGVSRLCVGVSWQDCIYDVSVGEGLVADLQRWLVQIGSKS